jgi:glucokinase
MSFLVLGDLGGTNCRLELVPCFAGAPPPPAPDSDSCVLPPRPAAAHRAKYRSNSAASLTELLTRFLAEPQCAAAIEANGPVALFSIAVCGPVTDGRAILLAPGFGEGGWVVDTCTMRDALKCEVTILNDFHSVGLGLARIPQSEIHTLYDAGGRRDPKGVIACLGPGTGLGEVYAVPREGSAGGYTVCCSEGSMSDFVARTEEEWALRKWIAKGTEGGYVEVEMVASGEGLKNAYGYLREAHPDLLTNAALDAEILAADEPAGVIGQHGTAGADGADPLCVRAVDIFLDALGAEAGNMAIRYQAKGGVFIAGGGIANKLLPRIRDGRVAAAYVGKGHSIACYDSCPLFVATTAGDELGMNGAFEWALRALAARGE